MDYGLDQQQYIGKAVERLPRPEAPQAMRPGSLGAEFQEHMFAIETLHKTIADLGQRLSPVTEQKLNKAPAGGEQRPDPISPFARGIREATEKINGAIAALRGIADSLDL